MRVSQLLATTASTSVESNPLISAVLVLALLAFIAVSTVALFASRANLRGPVNRPMESESLKETESTGELISQ